MPHLRDGSTTPVPLAAWLDRLFEADPHFDQPIPVMVENDVNALAVLAIHQARYAEPDLVVVGVFDEGVGGGLIMDSRLRRGGNGRAMEIGHLAVGFRARRARTAARPEEPDLEAVSAGLPNFYTRCWCGHFGHVDTLAPPRRIQGMLGDLPLDQLGEIDSRDSGFGRAQAVFARSGAALGRALAHVSNTVNPSSIITYMPGPLAEPKPDTAAAAYCSAVHQEVTSAFAAGNKGDYLTIRPLPTKPEELALRGARAAAVCVLESFIEHALRLDGCTTTLDDPAPAPAASRYSAHQAWNSYSYGEPQGNGRRGLGRAGFLRGARPGGSCPRSTGPGARCRPGQRPAAPLALAAALVTSPANYCIFANMQ